METNSPIEVVRQQNWLEPIAERLQPAVAATLDNSMVPRARRFCTALGWAIRCTWSSRTSRSVPGPPLLCSTSLIVRMETECAPRSGFRDFGRSVCRGVNSGHRTGGLVQDRRRRISPHRARPWITQCHGDGVLPDVAVPSTQSFAAGRTAICFSRIDRLRSFRLSRWAPRL